MLLSMRKTTNYRLLVSGFWSLASGRWFLALWPLAQYIPMPGSGAGAMGAGGSFLSATRDSVVRTIAATDAALSRVQRVTLVGSTIPLVSCRRIRP